MRSAALKRQVAQAIAEPSKIKLDDPEIIQLGRQPQGGPPSGAPTGEGDLTPTLNPKEASRIVMQGAPAMQGLLRARPEEERGPAG